MKKLILIIFIFFSYSIVWAQSLTPIHAPLYVAMGAKTPYACRYSVSGLLPNTTYRYLHGFVSGQFEYQSAGNPTFIRSNGDFVRLDGSFQVYIYADEASGQLVTDASGSYTGWFIVDVDNHFGTTFYPGATVYFRLDLDDGAGGGYIQTSLTSTVPTTVMTSGSSTEGTAMRSTPAPGAAARNFVFLYEDANPVPIAGTFIEDEGTDNSIANEFADFYADHVNGVDRAWGTVIPNNLANGIRKIVQYSFTDATEVGSNTSPDGRWPAAGGGTVNTVNATGGLVAPIVLDGSFVALTPPRTPQTVAITSSIPSEVIIGDPAFTVSATASSGLTDIQFTASPSGIFQITGNTVTAIGPGTATITAAQLGDVTYDVGMTTSSAIVVKRRQTISFAGIPSKTYGDDVFALEVSSDNATIPLTLASSDPAIADVFYESLEGRWKVQIRGAGDVEITATQAGNSEYKETSVVKSLSIAKKALTITADNKTREINTANPAFTATYDGFIAGEDESDLATPAVLSSAAIETSPLGEYEIVVSGASSPNYAITFENGTLQIVNKLQVVTFPPISDRMYGDPAFNPGATSNTGIAPVYSSNNSAVAVVENNEIRIRGAGQVRVTATFPAINEYGPTSAERTFTVRKKPLTITADNKVRAYGQENPQLTVTYVGFVNGETSDALPTKPVLQTTAGRSSEVNTYAITVSGATSVNYDITHINGTFTVSKATLTITAQNKTKVQGTANPPLTLTYNGFVNGETSGVLLTQPVLYTSASQDSPIGDYEITLSGASAANYEITHVNAMLTITQGSRTLIFNPIATRTFGDADFDPGARLSSNEQLSYTSSNPLVATIDNGKVHIVAAGATTITATAPANSAFANTPSKSQSLVVNRAPQMIHFEVIPDLTEGQSHTLVVNATSGLEVELKVDNTTIAMLEGTQLVPLREGITKITAVQRGNTNYLPAEAFVQEIRVADSEGNFVAVHAAVSINGDDVNERLVITGIENYPDNKLSIVNRNGTRVFEMEHYDNQFNVFEGKGNANYLGFLPEGTYFYLLEFRDGNEQKRKTGFFVLKY